MNPSVSVCRNATIWTGGPLKPAVGLSVEVRHSKPPVGLRVYRYVVMPEHVHLLISEPERGTLADVLKSLKQGVARRLVGEAPHFWQKRYYDFNIRKLHAICGEAPLHSP